MNTAPEIRQFQVVGEIAGMYADRAAPRYLLMSEDGLSGCLARREGDHFHAVIGPFTYEAISLHATNVLAGNHRSTEWKDGPAALAIACATFFTLYGRATAAPADQPKEAAE